MHQESSCWRTQEEVSRSEIRMKLRGSGGAVAPSSVVRRTSITSLMGFNFHTPLLMRLKAVLIEQNRIFHSLTTWSLRFRSSTLSSEMEGITRCLIVADKREKKIAGGGKREYLGRWSTMLKARSGTELELKPEHSPEWKRKTGPKRESTPWAPLELTPGRFERKLLVAVRRVRRSNTSATARC